MNECVNLIRKLIGATMYESGLLHTLGRNRFDVALGFSTKVEYLRKTWPDLGDFEPRSGSRVRSALTQMVNLVEATLLSRHRTQLAKVSGQLLDLG
ncbi:hypothetical protein [Roseateles sp.]|uniref:hypothetical protein n=1 Tax=Roseateles sp. TaxID=1971397 RepID=UPI00286A1ABD|nr:hypothetical protein [Roseateles sp.]